MDCRSDTPESREEVLIRVGFGYDIHRLTKGRKLILGGVLIPFEKGLLGHSDADVLLHAICDALLGAVGLGDIGLHFPDTDPRFKDASSATFVKETFRLVNEEGFFVNNLDATIITEVPKLAPFREAMQNNIAGLLGISSKKVNVKATTTEGVGGIGRGEAIGAMCVVSLLAKD